MDENWKWMAHTGHLDNGVLLGVILDALQLQLQYRREAAEEHALERILQGRAQGSISLRTHPCISANVAVVRGTVSSPLCTVDAVLLMRMFAADHPPHPLPASSVGMGQHIQHGLHIQHYGQTLGACLLPIRLRANTRRMSAAYKATTHTISLPHQLAWATR